MTDRVLDITAEQYHADQIADTPSLSSSIAHTLITQSPAHARARHPKLNPAYEREDKDHYDFGTAAHDMLLRGTDEFIRVVYMDDWRKKEARELRDEARAAGKVPMLEKDYLRAQQMVDAVRAQIPTLDVDPPLFVDGKPEQTLVWVEDNGVVCRARCDWLLDAHDGIQDLKTTSRSANPEKWSRTLFDHGCDIQAAMYVRGLRRITGRSDCTFQFVVAETQPPFAMSVISLAPDAFALAAAKLEYAIDLWAECLRTDSWPAYPTRVCWAEAPPWELARWEAIAA
jgi:hypothetical protein